jgi:hypothetical protein
MRIGVNTFLRLESRFHAVDTPIGHVVEPSLMVPLFLPAILGVSGDECEVDGFLWKGQHFQHFAVALIDRLLLVCLHFHPVACVPISFRKNQRHWFKYSRWLKFHSATELPCYHLGDTRKFTRTFKIARFSLSLSRLKSHNMDTSPSQPISSEQSASNMVKSSIN